MHIRRLFQPGRPLFSIELFPPKTEAGVENLKKRLVEIRACAPDYISVTYGAGGGTRHNTLEICGYIQQKLGLEAMAHLTCVAHSKGEIDGVLRDLRGAGIENIMALRGDPPRGDERFTPRLDGFRFASELVRAIRAAEGFGIGVAGYPEGHVECGDYGRSLVHQVEKVEAGGEVLVSQFFLDNAHFLRWRDDLRNRGVTIPIEAGILPPLSYEQISRFAAMCGVTVPGPLLGTLARHQDDNAASAEVGLEFSTRQVEELLAAGVDGIHLYALNRLDAIRAIEPLVRGREDGAPGATEAGEG